MGSAVDEFEEFNPCFFENSTEEQFYDAPAPSEDIWKKFELLPTPPRSPKHEPFYQSLNVPSTLEKLQLVSDILDDPMSKTVVFPPEECTFQIKCKDTCCNLNINSKLIQDCMWSGHNIFGTTNRESTQTTRSTNLSSNIDINAPTECVDPTAVFPYPVNGLTTRVHREQPSRSLGTDTPSDSGLSASDESDDDEEIDVVTVADKAQMTARARRPVLPATPTASAQVAAMHNYTAAAPKSPKPEAFSPRSPLNTYKRPRSITSQHSSQPPIKKLRLTVPSSELRIVHKLSYKHGHHKSGNSSRSGSDSDEGGEGRRAQHNVLERKRRNDLKSSFQRLRDNVPDLNAQDRAPKVTILKRATDYISLLRKRGNTLVAELERQKRTREALQKRFRQLKSCA